MIAKFLFSAMLLASAVQLSALPPNPFTWRIDHTAKPDSLTFFIDNFAQVDTAIGADSLIDSVVILKSSDSAQLAANYASNPALRATALYKDFVRLAWTWPIKGLSAGTRYFLGMTTRNRRGEWSQTLRIRREYTGFYNPLAVEVSETAAKGDSSLIIHFLNVAGTHDSALTIKLFYQPDSGRVKPDDHPTKTYTRARLLSNSYDTIPSFQSLKTYYFSVTCGNNNYPVADSGGPGFAQINTGNRKAFTTANYSPPSNPLQFDLVKAAEDSVSFGLKGTLEPSIDSIYLFLETDSAGLVSGYKTKTPKLTVHRSAAYGPFTFKPLTKGVNYYLGVALKNSETLWSPLRLYLSPILIPKVNVVIHAEILADFKAETKLWTVTVKDTVAGELSRVQWGAGWTSLRDSAYGPAGSAVTLSLTADTFFLSLKDPLGATRDTAITDFTQERAKLIIGQTRLDFSKVQITASATTLQLVVRDRTYLRVGKTVISPADSGRLASDGFVHLLPAKYWIKNEIEGEYRGDPNIYNTGFSLSYVYDTATFSYNKDLRFYRYIPVNGSARLEYLGGSSVLDNTGKGVVTLNNFKIDSLGDTVTVMIGIDPAPPVFDYSTSDLALNTADSTARFRFSVSDNTVNLDAAIRVFTYGIAGDLIPVLDTSITALKPGAGIPSPAVSCTLTVTGALKTRMDAVLHSGLFAAMTVSDGRRRFLYAASPLAPAEVSGDFNLVQKSWKIVSLPWILPDTVSEKSILNQIVNFHGVYDSTRERIYAEPGLDNSFRRFDPSVSDFNVRPGRAFLVNVRYSDDVNLHYTLPNPALQLPEKSSGYTVTGSGWRLVSLPFSGLLNLESVIRASKSARTGGPASDPADWQRRIWKLNQQWDLSTLFQPLSSLQDLLPEAKEGFLAYLFDGDTLVFPLLNETAFLPPLPGAAGKTTFEGGGDWRLNVSLSVNGPETRVLDDFNSFGAQNLGALSLKDLIMPGAGCEFGFADPAGLSCVQFRKSTGSGEAFTLILKNGESIRGDLEMAFSDLKKVPERYSVYLEDPVQGCAVNLRETGGRYGFSSDGKKERRFNVLVGDSGYINQTLTTETPSQFSLYKNSPNPFNPSTLIRFNIPDFASGKTQGTRLTLDILNIRGQCVKRLLDKPAYPGQYRVEWSGRNTIGNLLASGLYVYRLTVRDKDGGARFTGTRTMLLVK